MCLQHRCSLLTLVGSPVSCHSRPSYPLGGWQGTDVIQEYVLVYFSGMHMHSRSHEDVK